MSEKKLNPSRDRSSTKYPDRTFYGGGWRTAEQIEKQRKKNARWRAKNPEKSRKCSARYQAQNPEKRREQLRAHNEKRLSDPDYRRKRTIYMMDYYYRRKHERWADQGLTLRNDGQEGSTSGDRAAA